MVSLDARAVLVPLPPAVRRPAAAGAAGQRAGRAARAARRRRRMVRRARVSGRGGPARPGGAGLGPGRPRCCRTTGSALTWTGRAAPRTSSWPRFPAGVIAADAELAALVAADELARGSLEEAERHLARAPPDDRRRCPRTGAGASQVVLAVVRLRLARQRGDLPAVAEEAQRLLAPAETAGRAAARAGRGPARAGADQPRHRRGLGIRGSTRREPAPRARHRPGAPDRAALSRGHRPGALGRSC